MNSNPHSDSSSTDSAIRTENVCRHYAMGESLIRAVDGISLGVPAGEFVALLGTSGSGKSSLLNLIAGLDRPTSGAVVVAGKDLASLSRAELAQYRLHTVGMVFQSFNLIPSMTVIENVELPLRFAEVDRSQRDSLAREALERVGLGKRLHHRPSELSGGEQQRTALARALINRPKLLLADEPTGNLDSRTGTEIMEPDSRVQRVARHDGGDGDARARARGALRAATDFSCGRQAGGRSGERCRIGRARAGRPSVKAYDLAELAVRNLRESILRNSLTTVGISVGVASLVAMLSLGIGLQQLATRRLVKSGLFDTVVVTSRRDLRNFNRGDDDNNAPSPAESPALSMNPRAPRSRRCRTSWKRIPICASSRRSRSTASRTSPWSPASRRRTKPMTLSKECREVSSLPTWRPKSSCRKSFAAELLGKTAKPGSDETPLAEIAKPLLGKEMTMRYSERVDASGSAPDGAAGDTSTYSIQSHELQLKIVGVTDLDPDSMRGAARARVMLPLNSDGQPPRHSADRFARHDASGQPRSDLLDSQRAREESHADSGRSKMPSRRWDSIPFPCSTPHAALRKFFAIVDVFLGVFGSLALAVASIGIVNTLVMAILERRREIGIMKAIGASDVDVKKLFFRRSRRDGTAWAGCWEWRWAGRSGASSTWARMSTSSSRAWPPSKSGLFRGGWLGERSCSPSSSACSPDSIPLRRAARLDPVQALRYE